MAAKLQGIVPQQNYELIRDRIGLILFEELLNQYQLSNEEALNVERVYINHFGIFDQTQAPVINVTTYSGDYDNHTQKLADGTYNYFIDFYTQHPDTAVESGDSRAQINLERLMGVCRAIIMNPVYTRLDFLNPGQPNYVAGGVTISSRKVAGFIIPSPGQRQQMGDVNTENLIMGRMTIEVKSAELVELKDAVLCGGNDTEAKLYNTGHSYYWSINIPE